jgi:hypothetical protein
MQLFSMLVSVDTGRKPRDICGVKINKYRIVQSRTVNGMEVELSKPVEK